MICAWNYFVIIIYDFFIDFSYYTCNFVDKGNKLIVGCVINELFNNIFLSEINVFSFLMTKITYDIVIIVILFRSLLWKFGANHVFVVNQPNAKIIKFMQAKNVMAPEKNLDCMRRKIAFQFMHYMFVNT